MSASKLFSRASALYNPEAHANEQVNLLDAAVPGTLPTVNMECVKQTIRTGLSLGGTVEPFSAFDRKHYYYTDLPLGFQITQLDHPLISGGSVTIDVPKRDEAGRKTQDTERMSIRVNRIQLEQDSGKSNHTLDPRFTFVDLNRAGVALMEIVTEPDLRSSDEAYAFVKKLQSILRHIGASDGNMESGSIRCDVNVSVRPAASSDSASTSENSDLVWNNRVEMKNLNSLRSIMRAIEYEAARQVELLEAGQHIERETRQFDAVRGKTVRMRSKEDAVDYRFMPDPDLRPLELSAEFIEAVRTTMPDQLDAIQDRFEGAYGLSRYDASVVVGEPGGAVYLDAVLASASELEGGVDEATRVTPKQAANWLANELLGRLNESGGSMAECPIRPDQLAEVLHLVNVGKISGKTGKDVVEIYFSGSDNHAAAADTGAVENVRDKRPLDIVTAQGWLLDADHNDVEGWIAEVLAAEQNATIIDRYREGNTRVAGAVVGQVMKRAKGKADPKVVHKLVVAALEAL